MKRNFLLLLLSLIIFETSAQLSTKLKIQNGWIQGVKFEKTNVLAFKGIPFAAPPVGNLRWKAPQPVENWDGTKECLTPPASAMQNKPLPYMCWSKEFQAPLEPLSEDCLYLNVWTSASNSTDKLPVIVWIHGGAFTGGSGTVPLYDGEEISDKGCVFVTINYRLGIFGFLVHPELSAESTHKVSGNYGILDQIAALKWVKENIAAFGGNPDNITIAGQSAGAYSVNALMVSPLAKGLFHKLIAQSGGMFNRIGEPLKVFHQLEDYGKTTIEKAGIKTIAELRTKSTEEIMAIQGQWRPVTDNVVIFPIVETFEAGKQNDVPLLTGWNADDGVMFGPAQKAGTFIAEAKKRFGNKSDEFLKLFPANNDEEAKNSQKMLSQLGFGWQNYTWACMQQKYGKSNAWLYYFSHVPPGEPNYGAFHSAEFGYALHTLRNWERPFADWDYKLEEIMSSYWVNFATKGNPNGNDLPEWPQFDAKNPKVIELGNEVKAREIPYYKQLKFLDGQN